MLDRGKNRCALHGAAGCDDRPARGRSSADFAEPSRRAPNTAARRTIAATTPSPKLSRRASSTAWAIGCKALNTLPGRIYGRAFNRSGSKNQSGDVKWKRRK